MPVRRFLSHPRPEGTHRMRLRFALLLFCLLPLAAFAADAPVEGTDYQVNPQGKRWNAPAGTIEVVEVFGYTCPHCAHFDPLFQAWKAKQPKDVRVSQLPAPFGGYWLPYARAFFAAQQLNLLNRSHEAVFKALHETRELPIQNASALEIGTFYSQYGITAQQFADVMGSASVDKKMAVAGDFAKAAQIEYTPSVVVNGRYTVTPGAGGFEKTLRTVDWLIARERDAARKP